MFCSVVREETFTNPKYVCVIGLTRHTIGTYYKFLVSAPCVIQCIALSRMRNGFAIGMDRGFIAANAAVVSLQPMLRGIRCSNEAL